MSVKPPKPKLNRQILDEASDWFVDFRVGDVDSSARERFDLWLRQSPEHVRAYMEIANTYVALPALNPTRKVDVQELIAYARTEGNVVSFDHAARPNQPLSPAADLDGRPSSRRPRRRAFALAASIAIVCVTGSLVAWLGLQWHSTYSTDVGERLSITLEDGSTIDLNARSRIRVRFSKGERMVQLLEGQALFGVVHDVSRPFIVSAGNTAVRAVGTQFDVYRKRSGTTVTVVEGRVAVSGPAHPAPLLLPNPSDKEGQGTSVPATSNGESGPKARPRTAQEKAGLVTPAGEVFVSAGEQVTVTDQTVAEPKRTNIAATTAWTQHRLIFDATPLADVVEEFNRYNARQIVIEDRELSDFHVSGVYSSIDPASLMRFLRQQPEIDVIETDAGVRITRK